jgi:hypothetical protein
LGYTRNIEQLWDHLSGYGGTTRLIAAVVTQIFSYMMDSGVRYGYICTGEAFVFLHIPCGIKFKCVAFLIDDIVGQIYLV